MSETPAPQPAQQRLLARDPIAKQQPSPSAETEQRLTSLGQLHTEIRALRSRGRLRLAAQLEAQAGPMFPPQLIAQVIGVGFGVNSTVCNTRQEAAEEQTG